MKKWTDEDMCAFAGELLSMFSDKWNNDYAVIEVNEQESYSMIHFLHEFVAKIAAKNKAGEEEFNAYFFKKLNDEYESYNLKD